MVLKNLFTGQQERNRHREHLWTGERGGKDERYGESNMETFITIGKIDSQWEFAVWKLTQGLCFKLDGRGGEGDGREVQKGGDVYIYTHMADSC